MSDTFYYSWPRRPGKSSAIKAWKDALAKQADPGGSAQAVSIAEYIAFFHSDPLPDLIDGEIGSVKSFRLFTSRIWWPPRKLQRSASQRKRARVLKWRRSL